MSSIRNIAVGLPIRDGHVLVLDGEDSIKGETFHRAIGGGIEFGETAEEALRREFTEELGVTLDTVTPLGVWENIFVHEGRRGHEIAHFFAVEAAEIDRIPLDAELKILDEGSRVHWVDIATATHPFYPEGAPALLTALAGVPTSDRVDIHRDQLRRNLIGRQRILRGYLSVLDELPRLVEVCMATPGDDDALRFAVAEAFGLDEDQARAVVDLQVRRFSPLRTEQIRWELTETGRMLADLDD